MCRFTLRFVVALFTFIIGITAASVWMVSRIPDKEEPPCRDCSAIYSPSEIPTVTLCELSANPERYRNKRVRVRAIFHHDAMTIILYDHECNGGAVMYAGVAEQFESCAGARQALTMYSGFESWYDDIADVVVVGRLGPIDPGKFYHGRVGLTIMCLERAGPRGFSIYNRVRYTIGKLGL